MSKTCETISLPISVVSPIASHANLLKIMAYINGTRPRQIENLSRLSRFSPKKLTTRNR
jgi:hypothetical protein